MGGADLTSVQLCHGDFAVDILNFFVDFSSVAIDVLKLYRAVHRPNCLLDHLIVIEGINVDLDLQRDMGFLHEIPPWFEGGNGTGRRRIGKNGVDASRSLPLSPSFGPSL